MPEEALQCSEDDGPGDGSLVVPLLAPLAALRGDEAEQQQCGSGGVGWRHPSSASYTQQYLRMAAWLGALFAGYAVQRACCQVGLPYDGLRRIDFLEFFSDATSTALWGAVLGWFVGITCPRRFRWLFSRRRWYAWATLLGTPPVYSAISNVDALKRDLAHLGAWGLPFILLWSSGMAAIAATVVWHIRQVAATRSRADVATYVASRLLLLGCFAGSAAVLRRQGVDMHLHHLYLGWSLALWAELDRPLSAVTLAVGCGIFVQGIGAYSFAPVFQEGCFSSPTAPTLRCDFWAEAPFALRICAAAGPLPSHACT
ncbi:hypothetical protein ABPG75_000270 [Micractinium tetrahymenae]